MVSKPTLCRLFILATTALLLAACQGNQTPAPTNDVNLLYTQAAKTIVSGLQATQDALPSSTPTIPPTATNTREPTADVPSTATALAGQQAAATTTQAAAATATATPLPATATLAPFYATATPPQDLVQFVALSPSRGVSVTKSASWDMSVTVKNVGGKTWNKGYSLSFHSGDQMGSPNDYFITKEVKPGDSFVFVFTMTAPGEAGKKQVYWVFRDDNGADMMYIDFDVNVTD